MVGRGGGRIQEGSYFPKTLGQWETVTPPQALGLSKEIPKAKEMATKCFPCLSSISYAGSPAWPRWGTTKGKKSRPQTEGTGHPLPPSRILSGLQCGPGPDTADRGGVGVRVQPPREKPFLVGQG